MFCRLVLALYYFSNSLSGSEQTRIDYWSIFFAPHSAKKRLWPINLEGDVTMQIDDNAPCVLVYGEDALLIETRAKVIQTRGFRTCEAKSDSELSQRLNQGRCKAIVLCHTLSELEAERASLLARQKIPGIRVIAMARSSSAYDESLGNFVRPEALLAVVERTILH